MLKRGLVLLVLLALSGIISAGTVTLTGTCGAFNIKNNTLPFTLSNSGNDTAYNLLLTPHVGNAQTTQSVFTINTLGPGQITTINMGLSNITRSGTSAVFFSLAYQQSSSVFTAVFPCLVPIRNATVSQVYLSLNQTIIDKSTVNVRVRAFNAGAGNVTANVSLILPPTFTFKSAPYVILAIPPYKATNATFLVNFPLGYQAAYSAAASATYAQNSLSYASLVNFVISTSLPSGTSVFSSIFLYGAIAIVVIVLLLIILSLVRKNKKSAS